MPDYNATAIVLHLATPDGWVKNGKHETIAAIEKLLAADSPVETGPGGSRLMGLIIRTDGKGEESTAKDLDSLRKEYAIGELAEYRQIARMRWENYKKAVNRYETSEIPTRQMEIQISLAEGRLAQLMPYVLGIDPEENEQEPCSICSGAGCPDCRESFSFLTRAGEELATEEAVFQALGAVSACWSDLSGAGNFQSSRADVIGEALMAFLKSKQPSADNDLDLDLDLLEQAYNLLCGVSAEDADSHTPGWSTAFKALEEAYHRRLKTLE